MKKLLNNIGSIWHLRTIFVMIISQVILCQINTFCHQLNQDMTTNFVRFMKIYTNDSEIQTLSFESQNHLCKSV